MSSPQNATMTLATAQAQAQGRSEGSAFARWWARSWHPVVFVVAVLILWWVVTAMKLVPPFIIPSPGDT